MSAFDKIIGYENIKGELSKICDMIHNREIYEKLGAKLPQGVLLYGDPGLGKTLMAGCFIEESGLKAYTVRRNKGNADFIEEMTAVFSKAKENTPCVVFLDDVDKFANEDNRHRDAEEYVAVQAGIDDVKDRDVFILATANDIDKLPESLIRSGRFDIRIEFNLPSDNDADEIVRHYLAGKKVSEDVNASDLSKMIRGRTCADLETILNDAAVNAAFERRSSIRMDDLVKSVLSTHYGCTENNAEFSFEEKRKIALHEAGHLVVSEVLCPGSVGLASIRSTVCGDTHGFIHCCKATKNETFQVLISLAGKAAVELYYSDTCALGCYEDLNNAYRIIRDRMAMQAACGFEMLDVTTYFYPAVSESMNSRSEAITHAELERHLMKAKDILLKNRAFLEKTADALIEKETLLYSDIQKIKEETAIIAVAV